MIVANGLFLGFRPSFPFPQLIGALASAFLLLHPSFANTHPRQPLRQGVQELGRWQDVWRTGPGGTLWAEAGDLRLIVQQPEGSGGLVRFKVLRQEAGQETMLGSGTTVDVRAAMEAARQMADRFDKGGS